MINNSKLRMLGVSMVIASMMMLMTEMNKNNSVEAASCSRKCKKVFANGYCDDECNTLECFFDGGDCFSTGAYYDDDHGYDYDEEEKTKSPTSMPTKKPTKKRGTAFPTMPTVAPTKPTSTPTQAGLTLSPTSAGGVDTSKYNIEIVFVGTIDNKIKAAFLKAQAKWESIIKNDIPNTYTYKKGTTCWESFTKMNQDKIVDDLMIFAQVTRIDGPGSILGSAGPCFTSNSPKLYSRVGLMQFDSADMAGMVSDGTIDAVILHEMGHVIGIGTLWEDYDLIQYPTRSQKNAFYTGAGGIEGQKQIQGSGKPIVETDGGGGTAYGHWDEDTYDNELMTGYAGGEEKFSLLTILSLQDMGFTVDASKADSFVIPGKRSGLRGEEGSKKPKRPLGDDVIHKPAEMVEVDPY